MDLNKRSVCETQYAYACKVMLSHSSESLAVWRSVSESVYFRAAALQEEAEKAAGLSGFMRLHWKRMAATVYWDRHSVHNLSCYQTSWEEDSEWGGITHSFSHLSSNFPLHYFCHYTPVSWAQWWNLYFGWQVSAWLHLMSNKWFIIQTDHVRSVRWTFRFDIDH